ncbi:hypothetical protein SAMN05421690_101848 [Nitrosomonas sp. Nm51]|uniref:hypothetical protein n=1 Tax=Nitrosomonas sp. Nm51 TaxID=133720 RepID=UPI0008CBC070|nr:hypothetical protein [Nitrosomonas sp. Nm51]SER31300.1 hypothetical protein SAMN05421690_101848 [Nitrosomonas sp. Nm51]
MKKFFLVFLLYIFANKAYALSIVYDGFECEADSAVLSAAAQSRFSTVENLQDDKYRLLLTGGYLVFEDNICIEPLEEPFENITTIDPLITNLSQIAAIAHFRNNILVVSYGLMKQNTSTTSGIPTLFADINFPKAFTLTFEYLPSRQAFKLISASQINNPIFLS